MDAKFTGEAPPGLQKEQRRRKLNLYQHRSGQREQRGLEKAGGQKKTKEINRKGNVEKHIGKGGRFTKNKKANMKQGKRPKYKFFKKRTRVSMKKG